MDLEKRTEIPNSLEEHWMPFTSNRDFKENPRLMVKAEGVYYTDHYGNKLIDASSKEVMPFVNVILKNVKEPTKGSVAILKAIPLKASSTEGFLESSLSLFFPPTPLTSPLSIGDGR